MSTTISVSSLSGLISALGQARGGETILLAGGDYGDLSLTAQTKINLAFPSTVTIAAADPASPPVFSGLSMNGVSNLSFRDISFDYVYQDGQPTWFRPFQVTGGANIAFEGCRFEGDLARGLSDAVNGFPTGFGLGLTDVTGVRVENCDISNFFRGLVVANCNGVEVRGNEVHDMRMAGMVFAAVQGVVVENNHIHDFRVSLAAGDHPDMIQFFTSGTTRPSTDIVIRNNLLDIGQGDWTQSIFMRNELVDRGLAGSEMFYRNVLIEGNLILNAHAHGITVGETAGLVIRANSVLHDDGRNVDGADNSVEIPKINLAATSTNVTVTQNATATISGFTGQAGWTVTANALVQDQNALAAGFYGDVFEPGSLIRGANGLLIPVARTGSILDQLDAGAPATLGAPVPAWWTGSPAPEPAPEPAPPPPVSASAPPPEPAVVTPTPLDAAFTVRAAPGGDVQARVFDASSTTGDQPAGTRYLWTFGDGGTAEGRTVTYAYQKGGLHEVTLRVITPSGATSTETAQLTITGDELIRLDDSGVFMVSPLGADIAAGPRPAAMTDEGLQLGSGVSATVARSHLAPLFSTNDVTMRLVLEADSAGTTGEIARLQGSFVMSVNRRGELEFSAWSSGGSAVKLASKGLAVNQGAEHEIEVRLDGGRLSLWVDGSLMGETAFRGTFASSSGQALTFGSATKDRIFNGDLAGFEIDLDDGSHLPGFDAAMTDRFATLTSNDPLF